MDYDKLVCRSPFNFFVKGMAKTEFSVPISIGANDEEFLPWSKDLNRYNYYTPTQISYAVPDEANIG